MSKPVTSLHIYKLFFFFTVITISGETSSSTGICVWGRTRKTLAVIAACHVWALTALTALKEGSNGYFQFPLPSFFNSAPALTRTFSIRNICARSMICVLGDANAVGEKRMELICCGRSRSRWWSNVLRPRSSTDGQLRAVLQFTVNHPWFVQHGRSFILSEHKNVLTGNVA